MIIEQALHGYNKGHGLLASSFPFKPNDDSSLMSVLSDWTGYRDVSGEDAYMTFYPLSHGERYAFAKTWYAEEMERPGCVWTHTLIVDLNGLDRNFDFRVLKDYFRRPQKDKYEIYRQKIEIKDFERRESLEVFKQFDGVSLMAIYMLLLGNNKNLFFFMDKPQLTYIELCFYLLQYMPVGMLKNVSLSTGSMSRRKCGEKDFSIQFTDNPTHMSLSNAPWKGKIEEENFADAIRYIFEQSKTANDPFPSLMRLFKEDIGDEQDKLMAFSVLMKKLDIALTEKVGQRQFAEVLHILEKHFPRINEGIRLKCNFLSKKISGLYGTEKDYLFQIASLDNVSFLHPEMTLFDSRLEELDRNEHAAFVELINDIAKLEHVNDVALKALNFALNTMNESEMLSLANENWEHLLPLLKNSERFFESGIWLKLPHEQFSTIALLYCNHDFHTFHYWEELLQKTIDAEALIDDNLAQKMVGHTKDSVKIIFDAINSQVLKFVSPFLKKACLVKKQEFLEWMLAQNILNENVEQFVINEIYPNDILVKKAGSKCWEGLLNGDTGKKNIEYYIYLYILAHNWQDLIAISMLKHSFYHLYIKLSNNELSESDWHKLSVYTANSYFIEKWDKCKILSRGLIDYLLKCDVVSEDLRKFTPDKKVNDRLLRMWKKQINKK